VAEHFVVLSMSAGLLRSCWRH